MKLAAVFLVLIACGGHIVQGTYVDADAEAYDRSNGLCSAALKACGSEGMIECEGSNISWCCCPNAADEKVLASTGCTNSCTQRRP